MLGFKGRNRSSQNPDDGSLQTPPPPGTLPDVNPSELQPMPSFPGQFITGQGAGGDDGNGNSTMHYGVYDQNGKFLGMNQTITQNGTTTNYGYSWGTPIPEGISFNGPSDASPVGPVATTNPKAEPEHDGLDRYLANHASDSGHGGPINGVDTTLPQGMVGTPSGMSPGANPAGDGRQIFAETTAPPPDNLDTNILPVVPPTEAAAPTTPTTPTTAADSDEVETGNKIVVTHVDSGNDSPAKSTDSDSLSRFVNNNPAAAAGDDNSKIIPVTLSEAPQPYQGSGGVAKVTHPQPNITITTTGTGAVVEQVAGNTPYTIKAAPLDESKLDPAIRNVVHDFNTPPSGTIDPTLSAAFRGSPNPSPAPTTTPRFIDEEGAKIYHPAGATAPTSEVRSDNLASPPAATQPTAPVVPTPTTSPTVAAPQAPDDFPYQTAGATLLDKPSGPLPTAAPQIVPEPAPTNAHAAHMRNLEIE